MFWTGYGLQFPVAIIVPCFQIWPVVSRASALLRTVNAECAFEETPHIQTRKRRRGPQLSITTAATAQKPSTCSHRLIKASLRAELKGCPRSQEGAIVRFFLLFLGVSRCFRVATNRQKENKQTPTARFTSCRPFFFLLFTFLEASKANANDTSEERPPTLNVMRNKTRLLSATSTLFAVA